MEAETGNKETARMGGNVPMESGTSGQGETDVGQQEMPGMTGDTPMQSGTSSQEEADVGERGTPRMGGALPKLNPTAASFTPTVQPACLRLSTPPSLERLARELKELKSSGRSNKERLVVAHDQRRQLLSHVGTAKAEIDALEGRLRREESIEGSQDILNQLKELNGLHGWVGQKWAVLGEQIADLEAEIAMP